MKKPLKIIKDPHPVLRKRAQPVSLPISEQDYNLLKKMINHLKMSQNETYSEKFNMREGVGLAAPQVNVSKRLVALYYVKDDEIVEYGLVNPTIISSSVKKACLSSGEGCLSIDELYEGYVYRQYKVTVKAFDIVSNKDVILTMRGFDAIVIQHEIDHLNGVLFYDHIDKKDPFKIIDGADIIDR
jgi:peptide deformylase